MWEKSGLLYPNLKVYLSQEIPISLKKSLRVIERHCIILCMLLLENHFCGIGKTRGLDDCAKNADKTISLRTQKESQITFFKCRTETFDERFIGLEQTRHTRQNFG
jgi:hypothetical protein